MMKLIVAALFTLAFHSSTMGQNLPRVDNQVLLDLIKLPPGFSIDVYPSQPVPSARMLAVSSGSKASEQYPDAVIVYVGSISFNYSSETEEDIGNGRVYALVDLEGTGSNVTLHTILGGKNDPSGVAYREGSLYVAERDTTTRYDNVDEAVLSGQLPLSNGKTIFEDTAPSDDSHKWHFIRFGPDGMLYMSRGAFCNVCFCYAFGNFSQCAINRITSDGTEGSAYVTGIRNTVGFDWDVNGNLWADVNGRDDFVSTTEILAKTSSVSYNDKPDDTLIFIPANSTGDTTTVIGQTNPSTNTFGSSGLNFGYPYCYWEGAGDPLMRSLGPGSVVPDATLYLAGSEPGGLQGEVTYCSDPANNQPPSQALGPHTAPLGMRFYKGDMFPAEYKNSIFMAQHGSWDRNQGIGYRVVNLQVDPDTGDTISYNVFAEGWLETPTATSTDYVNTGAWGRPVDVEVLPDGSLLVSDDYANTVYRISYDAAAAKAPASGAGVQAG